MTTPRRREEIRKLIEEGRQAFAAGQGRQAGPRNMHDFMHWATGWDAAEAEQQGEPEPEPTLMEEQPRPTVEDVKKLMAEDEDLSLGEATARVKRDRIIAMITTCKDHTLREVLMYLLERTS